jgi:hypothetical protein
MGMNILYILFGAVLLILGRRLFWLLVGVVGFVVGINLAALLFGNQPAWVVLIVAFVAGLVGSILAVFLQRLMVALAGFLATGYILTQLLASFQVDLGSVSWLVFLLGGALGAVLASAAFDWALLILSSLIGASLFVEGMTGLVPGFDPPLNAFFVLVLFLVGIAIQVGFSNRARTRLA